MRAYRLRTSILSSALLSQAFNLRQLINMGLYVSAGWWGPKVEPTLTTLDLCSYH